MYFIGKFTVDFQPIRPCSPSPVFDKNGKKTGEIDTEKFRTIAITADGRQVSVTGISPDLQGIIDEAVESRDLLRFSNVNVGVLPVTGGGINTYFMMKNSTLERLEIIEIAGENHV